MLLIIKVVLICLIYCDALVNSVPYRSSQDSERTSGAAFIDCNDSTLIKRLLITKIPFRCLEEVNEQIPNEPDDSQEANEFKISRTESQPLLQFQLKEVINPKNTPCEGPQNCGYSNISSRICEAKHEFVNAFGECVPIALQLLSGVRQTDLSDKSTSRICQEGFQFNPGAGLCIPKVNKASKSLRCRQGFTYSPANDDCLPIKTYESSSTKHSSSSNPVSDEGYFGISHELIGRDKCPKGTIYSSEIDLCVTIEHHSGDNQKHSFSDLSRSNSKRSILKENDDNVALKINYGELIGWSKCLAGEVYVSEVDLCL